MLCQRQKSNTQEGLSPAAFGEGFSLPGTQNAMMDLWVMGTVLWSLYSDREQAVAMDNWSVGISDLPQHWQECIESFWSVGTRKLPPRCRVFWVAGCFELRMDR